MPGEANLRTTQVIDVDDSASVAADRREKKRIADREKAATSAYKAEGAASDDASAKIISNEAKITSALEKRIQRFEKLASIAGKSGSDKLRAQQALEVQSLGDNESAIRRLNTAFEARIRVMDTAAAKAKQLQDVERQSAAASRDAAAVEQKRSDGLREFAAIAAGYYVVLKGVIAGTATYAARNETLAVVTERLAISNGLNVDAVLRQVAAVAKLGITTQEARNTVNQMIVAQLDVAKATNLARLAQDAAVVAGKNSSETLGDIIHGITTRQTDVLRTAGIQVSFDDAFKRAAKSLGIAATDLTEYQKRQIALNEVLAQAPKLAGAYEAAMDTAGKQMTSFSRFVDEAKAAVGERFLPTFGSVIRVATGTAKVIRENADAFASLAAILGGVTIAFTAFKSATFIIGLFSGVSGIILAVVAAIGALIGILALLNSKESAQRDSIESTIDGYKRQRIEIERGTGTIDDRIAALKRLDTQEQNSLNRLAQLDADIKQKPHFEFDPTLGTNGGFRKVEPQKFTQPGFIGPNPPTFIEGQYESRIRHRLSGAGLQSADPLAGLAATPGGGSDTGTRQASALSKAIEGLLSSQGLNAYRTVQQSRIRTDKEGDTKLLSLSAADQEGARRAYLNEIEDFRRKSIKAAVEALGADLDRISATQIKQFEDTIADQNRAATIGIESNESRFRGVADDIAAARDRALRGLTPAQTVSGRLGNVQSTLGINQDFLLQKSISDVDTIQRQQARDLIEAQRNGVVNPALEDAIRERSGTQAAEVQRKYLADLMSAQQDAAVQSAEIVRSAQERQFDSLKRSAEGVLDEILTHSQNIFQAIGGILKSTILTAIKDIVSSQVAATLFRMLNPGASVGFAPGGSAGASGGGSFGSFLGSLGLGAIPQFFGGSSSIAAPTGGSGAIAIPGSGPGAMSIPGLPGVGSALLGAGMMLGPGVASAGFGMPGAPGGTSGFASPVSIANLTGGIPYLGPLSGGGTGGIPGAGGLSSVAGGSGVSRLAGLAGLKSLFYNSAGNIILKQGAATTAAAGGIGGHLAGFISSPGAAIAGATIGLQGLLAKRQTPLTSAATVGGFGLAGASIGSHVSALGIQGGAVLGVGAGLAADGLRRGGIGGLVETTAGGTAIGYQLGGPVGAAVGAAVGFVAGTVRLFIKGARDQVKQQVLSLYKLKINESMADRIIAVAKQSYDGSFSQAIRSKEVMDMLDLYAQATGQQFLNKNRPYPVYLTETSKGLEQNPFYQNGQAFSYKSEAGIGVVGGEVTKQIDGYQIDSGSQVISPASERAAQKTISNATAASYNRTSLAMTLSGTTQLRA